MYPTDLERARRVAEQQIAIGWATAGAMLVARAVTVGLQLMGARVDPILVGQAVLKSALLIAVVVLYRRHVWPSHLLAAAWPVGFIYAWRVGQAPPLVLGVGLVVGLGLFLGARGVRARRSLRVLAVRAAPAV